MHGAIVERDDISQVLLDSLFLFHRPYLRELGIQWMRDVLGSDEYVK